MKLRFSTADKKWSKLVRERDGQCLYCGRKADQWVLNAHHFIRRSVKATRLMLENGVSLCFVHHTSSHDFSAHKTPEAFKRWFTSTFPERAILIEDKARQHTTERQAIQEFLGAI
jgi:hypothetical protein